MKAGISATSRLNVGFHRLPALMDVATIVKYWYLQLTAFRNNIGILEKVIMFAPNTKQDISTMVSPIENIHCVLYDAWEDLQSVH